MEKLNTNLIFLHLQFARKIHNYEITLNEAIDDQEKLKNLIMRLENYKPRNTQKEEEKDQVLESARKLLYVRNDIINAFRKKIFRIKIAKLKQKKKNREKNQKNN